MTSVVLPENITAWGRGPAHVTQVGVVALKGTELPIFNWLFIAYGRWINLGKNASVSLMRWSYNDIMYVHKRDAVYVLYIILTPCALVL